MRTTLDAGAAATPSAARDPLFVAAAATIIVGSGTALAAPTIVLLGALGLLRLVTGRPITSGWILLLLPPTVYVLVGMSNGQLTSWDSFADAIDNDFRVIAALPVLLYLATLQHTWRQAGWCLVGLTGAVSIGFVAAAALQSVGSDFSTFTSHHSWGFAAAATLVCAAALPSDVLPHRATIAVIAVGGVMVSGLRSGALAAGVGLLAVLALRVIVQHPFRFSAQLLVKIALTCGLAFALGSIIAPEPVGRITSTASTLVEDGLGGYASGADSTAADANVASRLTIWDRLLADADFTVPVRLDAGTVDDRLQPSFDAVHSDYSAHNNFLQLLVELGPVGMIAYLLTIAAGVHLLLQHVSAPARVAIGAIFASVLAFGLTANSLLSPAVLLPAAFYIHLLRSVGAQHTSRAADVQRSRAAIAAGGAPTEISRV